MSKTYNAVVLCSISNSEAYIADMIENAFLKQGFSTIVIGKNPYAQIDMVLVRKLVKSSHVIVAVITEDINLDVMNQILVKNRSAFNLSKKPVMVFHTKNISITLQGKGTYTFIMDRSNAYADLELEKKVSQLLIEFKKIIEDQDLLNNLKKAGLVLGGIGIGLGLLFSLYDGDDEND